MTKFPFYRQSDEKDCGPTCLKIIASYYNKTVSIELLRNLSENTREGSSLLGISDAAEKIGFRSIGARLSVDSLKSMNLPCIIHWNKNHYVVLYQIKKNHYYISDPAQGLLKYTQVDFLKFWIGNNANESSEEGITLLLEATPRLLAMDIDEHQLKFGFSFVLKYLLSYMPFIWQLIIGLIATSILQLFFPFLTQSIVDVGIKNQDLGFINIVLFSLLALYIGKTAAEVIRSWILLHLSTRINISLISDFFIKLMKLPISFFDVKMTGDILQRINDHERIEKILTNSSLNILFSSVNLLTFSIILIYYDITIFLIFFTGSILYFIWIFLFLKKRKAIDYIRFSQVSQEQSMVIELINGMQEIKLHNAEKKKRWQWEFIQAKLFKVSIKGLALEQYQNTGSQFINEVKNILITYQSAKLVIDGEITIGMMLAISYIVGQLNSPIRQLMNFIKELQDAKISLERLGEIHNKKDEESISIHQNNDLTEGLDLSLSNVSFHYVGYEKMILHKLTLTIPAKKITAIVGASGSGKTTLIKILLKFYELYEGDILYGNHKLKNISHKKWRDMCGVVMQEGYIFNDTIANNIAVGVDYIDKKRLAQAIEVANIRDFIETLPLSFNTQIGMEGVGLSTGQKQRILIARAVYKNPDILFFDEATSALDTKNEKQIMKNLNEFFNHKTVVIIAHRLSTVINADQIVVLDDGKIIEIGRHNDLVKNKGKYFSLVKNQLELGN